MSSSSEIVAQQASQVAATVKATKEKMMRTEWTKIDADGLDAMVEGVGTGRDFLNSLSAEETNAVPEAVAMVESAEAMLLAAIAAEKMAGEVKSLRMEMEDLGTTGEGDDKPGSFTAEWDRRLQAIFEGYAGLLEGAAPEFAQKLERELGYQVLLLKRVVHIDGFRYLYPKVHPSGFSATAD